MDSIFGRNLIGAALAAALVLTASAAEAGNPASNGNAVNIALSSTVQNACSLTTSTSSVSLGDLSVTPLTNSALATLTETCNDNAGYTVSLTSLNAGTNGSALFLKGNTTGNTDQINYSLIYNTSSVSFTSGTAALTTASAPTGSTGAQKTLAITTTPGAYHADSYTDTLTITLAAR